MLVPFFCPLGTRGWGTRNRGTFMPCLAALVVRRAGPERGSVGSPSLWPAAFRDMGCSGTLLPGEKSVVGSVAR